MSNRGQGYSSLIRQEAQDVKRNAERYFALACKRNHSITILPEAAFVLVDCSV